MAADLSGGMQDIKEEALAKIQEITGIIPGMKGFVICGEFKMNSYKQKRIVKY